MLRLLALCSFVALVACDGTRVEFLLSDLKNDHGILTTGKRCDGRGSTRKCDTVITASIDTDTPSKAWPGYKPTSQWTKVLEADERESMAVNKIISKDICGSSSSRRSFDRANLRVLVADKDPGNKFSPIEQFECMSGREVATRRGSSDWSPVQPCKAKFNPDKVKLNYQWRAYPISNSECNQPVGDDKPSYGRRTYYN
ncbi:uncharacterized protein LOC129587390 [Paramacrobiotus metropolitanus]|uniref:uncharacterized protein LOC129587390 n=1 Tax=Paramacrobiotus metropolitanus TaxID=2943436 RepID=UPI00244587E6|nr:uncharacterized protein LOC129587390 [Paramacrobiotus metropolitanus]